MPSLRRGRWLARAKRDGVQYNLGTFNTFEQACVAEANFASHFPAKIAAHHRERDKLTFREELEQLLNRHSKENGSNTPDFVLAKYLESCLTLFDHAVSARDAFYGISPRPGHHYIETPYQSPQA